MNNSFNVVMWDGRIEIKLVLLHQQPKCII